MNRAPTENGVGGVGEMNWVRTENGGNEPWQSIDTAHVIDVNGTYHDWFIENACTIVLTRPDFYIFGTASHLEDAEALVRSLLDQIPAEIIDE